MASKDRIQRLKDDTRCKILEASLDIVKDEGWPSLSMRKIADKIEYTAPIIYEYFSNKDAILQELDFLFREFREKRKEGETFGDFSNRLFSTLAVQNEPSFQ